MHFIVFRYSRYFRVKVAQVRCVSLWENAFGAFVLAC